MAVERETYLGDGLYGTFDGFAVWLRAPREGGDHTVCLEPEVLEQFLALMARHYDVSKIVEILQKADPTHGRLNGQSD